MAEQRQIVFSYLLLALLVFVPVKLLLLPLIGEITQNDQASEKIERQLVSAKQQLEDSNKAVLTFPVDLAGLVSSEDLLLAENSNDAAYRLQQIVKPILLNHKAVTRQTSPTTIALEQGLQQSSLALSFSLMSDSLQPLLLELYEAAPNLNISLLSIQNPFYGSLEKRQNSSVLDVVLTLNVAFYPTAELSPEIQASVANAIDAVNDKPSQADLSERPTNANSSLEVNYVYSLFDRDARKRLRFPNIESYRLAAITLSPKGRVALVEVVDGGRKRLRQGDYIDAWRVESIDQSGIALSLNGEQQRLNL